MRRKAGFFLWVLLAVFLSVMQAGAAEGDILSIWAEGKVNSKEGSALTWQYANVDSGRLLGNGEPISIGAVVLSGTGSTPDYAPEYCATYQWRPVAPWMETGQGAEASRILVRSGIKSIGTYAFSNMRMLSSVVLEDGVKSVGEYAFAGNRQLSAVQIPDSVTAISETAFQNCGSVTLYCSQNSYAYAYAEKHGIAYRLTDCSHETTYWTETRKATCTSTGQRVQKCSKCKETVRTESLPKLGHDWSGWTTIAKATTASPKKQARTCHRCSAKEERSVGSPLAAPIKVKTIKLSGKTSLLAGKSTRLKAKVSPSNAKNKAISWRSSNTKYASVSSSGVVKAKTAGAGKTVTIRATARDGSGVKAVFRIKIKGAVKKIKLTAPKTLKVGKKATVKASVTVGKGGSKALSWSSSNKKYATVTSKGVVKALKKGKGKTVTITAKAKDGSGRKASVKIKLK